MTLSWKRLTTLALFAGVLATEASAQGRGALEAVRQNRRR
jgi:hypothetical protein